MRLITFASRWKKELQPEIVKAGKDIAKRYSKINDIKDEVSWNIAKDKKFDEISSLRDKTLRTRYKKGRVITRIFQDPLSKTNTNQNRLVGNNGKVNISDRGRNKLEQLKSKRNPVTSTKNIDFLGKTKRFIGKNKLGLGLAGVVSLGAIGYGVAKKIRSDKGKKRGRYLKNEK